MVPMAPARFSPASWTWPRHRFVVGGTAVIVAVAAWNASVLLRHLDDPLAPYVWLLTMLALIVATSLPELPSLGSGGSRRWAFRPPRLTLANLPWLVLILLLVVAVAARAPALGTIPIGIQADEGDRANWALRDDRWIGAAILVRGWLVPDQPGLLSAARGVDGDLWQRAWPVPGP